MRQKIMERIGAEGCYFLSLIRAGEVMTKHRIDAVLAYEDCLRNKWIREDCYIESPQRIMEYLAGGSWAIRHDIAEYSPKPGEVVVSRFEWAQTPTITYTHFILTFPERHDPLGTSNTVARGKPVSTRVLKRLA